ncbi:ATP-binding SpoIIE family protein phosphatase [Streptomyces albus]|uniref:ATP-binding SpoIIE family protein phosphatase n=1 Tax=Streptomyces albus TaxID=1888 RepID=UPI001436ABEC|nr:SpoIIE family protein phosphatase [Streptomyces albus]UVN57440.1 SpoIIE family protein phosphatase [Streptomyces albus]
MEPPAQQPLDDSPAPGFDGVAAALLDGEGRIRWWSRAAGRLLGWSADEVVGTLGRELVAREDAAAGGAGTAGAATVRGPAAGADLERGAVEPVAGRVRRVRLRHRDGHAVTADVRLLAADEGPGTLVVAVAPGPGTGRGPDQSLARELLAQDRIPAVQLDMEMRTVRANPAFEALRPEGAGDDWLTSLPSMEGEGLSGDAFRRVAEEGTALVAAEYGVGTPGSETGLALTCLRMEGPLGEPRGVVVTAREISQRQRARRRLVQAYERAFALGSSLDVVRTARDLAEVLVPALGELASVDFPDDVLQGRDPPLGYPGHAASAPRRVAAKAAEGEWPTHLVQVGEPVPVVPERPENAVTQVGEVLSAGPERARRVLGHDPALIARMLPEGMRDSLGCPLYHGGRFFGYVQVFRVRNPAPFEDADAAFLQELCQRTAEILDNAFRYTREHRTALVLQRSLLPPAATESSAAETAGSYLPAGGSASVGGDWFDAFPLSSLRLALVVGDVVGHGLRATATMARARTAVQTLADLDLPPEELLTCLDDLMQRMKEEADQPDSVGASCLFAVYDPVSRECSMASAGHPPPAVVLPDGSVSYPELVPGPVLGVGDNPFEVTTVRLPPGSVLALYTDGLLGHDREAGMERLRDDLGRLCPPTTGPGTAMPPRPLDRISADLVRRHPDTDHPDDDVTVLLARTRAVPESDIASWEYPADPAAVQAAREDAGAQLSAWGLVEESFTTELIVSELVTNAIRYAGGPVGLRLIRDHVLVCEVSDPSNTQPRLRRARSTDEGGRGLFLVAQLAHRWGSRYGDRGKTIWTEQELAPGGAARALS